MDKYEIFSKIGEGAYGEVLRGKSKSTGQIVAIKKFKTSDNDPSSKEVNEREIETLKALRGKENVVQLLDTFYDNGFLYLVFEFLSIDMLGMLRQHPSGLSPSLVQSYMRQLMKAIKSCHDLDTAHRDIKPENLLLTMDRSTLKLCDFGCARKIKLRMLLTDYIATRWYRAPELMMGAKDYTLAVDMWAAGCLMAEMVNSNPLIPCKDELEGLRMINQRIGLTSDIISSIRKSPISQVRNIKLPEHVPGYLDKLFKGLLSAEGLDFMKKLLTPTVSNRMTAEQALLHPYIYEAPIVTEVNEANEENVEYEPDFEEPKPVKKKKLVKKKTPRQNEPIQQQQPKEVPSQPPELEEDSFQIETNDIATNRKKPPPLDDVFRKSKTKPPKIPNQNNQGSLPNINSLPPLLPVLVATPRSKNNKPKSLQSYMKKETPRLSSELDPPFPVLIGSPQRGRIRRTSLTNRLPALQAV